LAVIAIFARVCVKYRPKGCEKNLFVIVVVVLYSPSNR